MNYAERTLNDITKERQLGDFRTYDPRIAELDAVWKKCGGDSFEYGFDMFVLGFTRGRRCERNLLKKAKRGAAV